MNLSDYRNWQPFSTAFTVNQLLIRFNNEDGGPQFFLLHQNVDKLLHLPQNKKGKHGSDQIKGESKFNEEKLIPLIRLTRKLSSCREHQQMKVLRHLMKAFRSDEISFSLMDVIVSGLCRGKINRQIPSALYEEIDFILPADEDLNLKDSVFESQLVQEQGDRDENGQTIKRKKKLPITLLRIPTDLQCQLFHYLHWKELMSVQKVCRALCVAARNPSAMYSLEFKPSSSRNGKYQNECYSRPRKLIIVPCRRSSYYLSESALVGNEKWGNNVVDLCSTNFDGAFDVKFQKLENCSILWSPTVLLNGSISSYQTLRELTLDSIKLTEDVIDQIQKFKNLEKLYLWDPSRNPDANHYSNPISLPNLEWLSFKMNYRGFRVLQRILIGSTPETVVIRSCGSHCSDPAFNSNLNSITKTSAIQQMNVYVGDVHFLRAMGEWLCCAKSSNIKLFEQINVSGDLFNVEHVSTLIELLLHSNRSTLRVVHYPSKLKFDGDNDIVTRILNALFGTLIEIDLERACPKVLMLCMC